MLDTGRVSADVVKDISRFKNIRGIHKKKVVLDRKQFATIVGNVMDNSDSSWPPEKVRAVLFFMYYTGISIKEFLHLKRRDIDLWKARVTVGDRRIRIPSGKLRGITGYLRIYFKSEPETTNAFNMTYRQIEWLIYRMNEFMPASMHITPHALRHCRDGEIK